jgi:hypothetical protein
MALKSKNPFGGDIHACLRALSELAGSESTLTNNVLRDLNGMMRKYIEKATIPFEFSEQILMRLGKVMEIQPREGYMVFASDGDFFRTMTTIVTDYSPKLATGVQLSESSRCSFSSHTCFELVSACLHAFTRIDAPPYLILGASHLPVAPPPFRDNREQPSGKSHCRSKSIPRCA